jgi:hypothetical protein
MKIKSLLILLLFFSFNETNCKIIEKPFFTNKFYSDYYRVTAKTRNYYGENYWVDLYVDAIVSNGYRSINNVYYKDEYGYKEVSWNFDYEYKNSYFVDIDSETYYFKF